MAELERACLCGAVRCRADAAPTLIAACHCVACQRNTGSAVSLNVAMAAGSVTIEGVAIGIDEGRFGVSGKPLYRSCCGRCVSPILGRGEAYSGLEFLKAGTLDDRSWVTLDARIRCAQKQPWVAIRANAEPFEADQG